MTIKNMHAGSLWKLSSAANGFAGPFKDELATQAAAGRSFELLDDVSKDAPLTKHFCRVKVRLLEDDYQCWFDLNELINRASSRGAWNADLVSTEQVSKRIPNVLIWLDKVAGRKNQYLWGGSIGPDFDCSGLVQAAFASEGIWLPRDAYQQERFCKDLETSLSNFQMLLPGDLLFFGSLTKCTHVALYIGGGMYCHSSGVLNGRNGIGFDRLKPFDGNPVANYYRSQFRGAGRVLHSYEGTSLL